MRYDGLTNAEIECLTTPIKDLTPETLLIAIQAKDKIIEKNRKENASFVRNFSGKPFIITDGIDPIVNHANGKTYDSKSKYYADLKASGHIIVESGMDKPRELRGDFDARKDVAKALNQLGY